MLSEKDGRFTSGNLIGDRTLQFQHM